MHKLFFLLVVGFLLLSFASANVTELVAINQDTIDGTGAFIGPRTPLTGASVEGYLCGDATCTFSAGTFLPSTFIPGTSITIDYPTTLNSPFGYALFYTAPGYIPYEVRSTYAGTGSVTGEAILAKKQSCTTPLTITSVQNTTNNATITGTITAPFTHTGPLPFIPTTLTTHYQTPITITLTLSNSTFSASTARSLPLDFSETRAFTLTQIAPLNTTYTYTFTATSTDTKCLSTPQTTSTGSITLGTLPGTNTTTPGTNTTSIPTVTIVSPQSFTYNTSTILINITTTNASTVTAAIPGFLSSPYTVPFNLSLPNGTYTLTANASNAAGSTLASVTFTINTSLTNTTTSQNLPPATVTNLRTTNQTTTSITWNWTNPADPDFSHVQRYLNNIFVGNSSAPSYTATGLLPNTTYTLTLFTVDNASIMNTTGTSNTTQTLAASPTTTGAVPGPITNLITTSITNTSLTWNWTNPTANFSYVGIYLNGIFQLNTSATNFTALNLQPNTLYTLSVFTFNASGTSSGVAVTNTARTLANQPTPPPVDNDNGKKKKTYTPLTTGRSLTPQTHRFTELNDSLPLTLKKNNQPNDFMLLWLLLLLLIITLLAILYVLTATKRTHKPYKMPGF